MSHGTRDTMDEHEHGEGVYRPDLSDVQVDKELPVHPAEKEDMRLLFKEFKASRGVVTVLPRTTSNALGSTTSSISTVEAQFKIPEQIEQRTLWI